MSDCLAHRGPDASNIFSEPGITLAHRRLAIIDLSNEANQPMSDNRKEMIIVFNGEIYNYQILREELSDEYEFKTKSDTEVILAGYRKWGKEVVHKLNGIFAFALWDRRDKSIFIARDHMGVKPLYYSIINDNLIFASEVTSILVHDIPRKLDLVAFNEFLRVLYVPEPRTMISEISKLPPGHSIIFKNGKFQIERYFFPEAKKRNWSYGEAKYEVKEAVEEAVKRQLVADVPVGVYLSGGIDSSIVLASASKVRRNMKTFSVGFELDVEEESSKFNRDFELAAKTAEYFGAEHHPLILGEKEVAVSLEDIIGTMDDPISNPTAIAMAHLSRFAKQEVTVALSGNGGDELFGGYERYRTSRIADLLGQAIPSVFLPKKARNVVMSPTLDRLALFEFEKDKRLSGVIKKEFFKTESSIKKTFEKYTGRSNDITEDFMLADISSWLPDQALLLGDKMSMRGSIEERVPLLDLDLVNLALELPVAFKVTPFTTKKILKDTFHDDLPGILFKEPKRGWFAPGAKWLRRSDIQRIVKEILSADYHEGTKNLFNWEAVRVMLDNHIEKREYNLTILWMILTFQIWAKKHSISHE